MNVPLYIGRIKVVLKPITIAAMPTTPKPK